MRFVNQTLACICIANVCDDGHRFDTFLFAQARGALGGPLVDIDACDVGTFPCAQHSDAPSVADWRMGILGWPRTGTDDDDATTGEPAAARRGAE